MTVPVPTTASSPLPPPPPNIQTSQSPPQQASIGPNSNVHLQTVSTITRPVPGHRSHSYTSATANFHHHLHHPRLPPPHLNGNHYHHLDHRRGLIMANSPIGHRTSRPAPRPPPFNNQNSNYHNYHLVHHPRLPQQLPPPPLPPFPRAPPMNHPLALHSHPGLLQDAMSACLVSIPLPPPPYSTLPGRGTNQRRLIDGHNVVSATLSAPASGCDSSNNDQSCGTGNGGGGAVSGQSNQSHNSSNISSFPSFLRSLTTSIVSNNTNTSNSNNNCNGPTTHGNNNGQSVQSNGTNICQASPGHQSVITQTGHRPLPPVLPSYHHLYASSSPSSIRRRRRRMRHARMVEEDDDQVNTYLTENRKQLICISLLVIGSILAFIGLVTVSLFAISFGVTFGLFSFILYRLLPTSKYSPSMTTPRRLSPRISIGGHPYVIASSSSLGGDGCTLGHLPPPPPSYQEAVSSGGMMHQLDPRGLISIAGHHHPNAPHSSGHHNPGFDASHIQHHLVHHHHRQESSIDSQSVTECPSEHGEMGEQQSNHEVTVVSGHLTSVDVQSGSVIGTNNHNNTAIESSSSSSSLSNPKSVIAVGFTDHRQFQVHQQHHPEKGERGREMDDRSSVKSGSKSNQVDHLSCSNNSTTCFDIDGSNDADQEEEDGEGMGSTNRLHFITIIEATI